MGSGTLELSIASGFLVFRLPILSFKTLSDIDHFISSIETIGLSGLEASLSGFPSTRTLLDVSSTPSLFTRFITGIHLILLCQFLSHWVPHIKSYWHSPLHTTICLNFFLTRQFFWCPHHLVCASLLRCHSFKMARATRGSIRREATFLGEGEFQSSIFNLQKLLEHYTSNVRQQLERSTCSVHQQLEHSTPLTP